MVELRGLNVEHVGRVVAEVLGVDSGAVSELARLVHRKTDGNPLFVRQFAATLRRKGLIEVDPAEGTVRFDATALTRERFTDNVVDLVVERIVALPERSRGAVEIAACALDHIQRRDIAAVLGIDRAALDEALVPAFEVDVLRDGDVPGTVVFQHDRVREGAYTLMPSERRAALHAALARRMSEVGVEGGRQRMMLADHMLAAGDCLTPEERAGLPDVLEVAAWSARGGNAHSSALAYLDASLALRPRFETRLARLETLYLLGRHDTAKREAQALTAEGLDDDRRVKVLRLRVMLATATLEYREALMLGREALAILGERIAIDPSRASVLGAVATTRLLVGSRTPEALLRLPRMTDERKRAAMDLLLKMAPAAYFASEALLPFIALKMVRLSLRHGNAPESAYGYVLYGVVHSALLGDPARGLGYGDLARRALQELDAPELEGSVFMVYAGFLLHWRAPLSRTLPIFLDGAERAIGSGDIENHGYLRYGHASYAFMAGVPLAEVDAFLSEHLDAVRRYPHDKTLRIMTMARTSIARMRGTAVPHYDEAEYLRVWRTQKDATSLAYHHKYRMLEAWMDADHAAVLRQCEGMTENLNGILGMAYQPFFAFYEALAAFEMARGDPGGRSANLRRAGRLLHRLARWERGGSASLSPRVALLRAEMAAARGGVGEAMRLFDEAITAAHAQHALHDVAIAHERFATFQADQGARGAASASFATAVEAYREWGADGWADRLAERHGVREARPRAPSLPSDGAPLRVDAFASRHDPLEVARELALVLRRRTEARAVSMLLALEGHERIVELGDDASEPTIHDAGAARGGRLPRSMVNYALRTGETVILDHRRPREPFASDPYRRTREGHDLICLPLSAGDAALGAVCLEIEGGALQLEPLAATAGAIAAQAAVALENASLVQRLRVSLDSQVELTSAHARFVPHAFLEVIGRPSIADVRLGDHRRREASVLFSDIRGFTSRIETLSPDDALSFVNGYLSSMEPFVQEQGGFIDSYVGDAVMAVFDRGPDAAVRAAGAMNRALRKWRGVDAAPLSEPLRIGIGIATGDLIFGTLGAANRMKCGVVGDVVNLAARIEGLTTSYGCPILVTHETAETLPDDLKRWTRPAGWTRVKGREAPVQLAEAFHADADPVRERKAAARDALERFTRLQDRDRLGEAASAIRDAAAAHPDDPLVQALRERFGTVSP